MDHDGIFHAQVAHLFLTLNMLLFRQKLELLKLALEFPKIRREWRRIKKGRDGKRVVGKKIGKAGFLPPNLVLRSCDLSHYSY